MNFRRWLEVYSRENEYLRHYLKDRELDIASYFHEFMHWRGANAVLRRAKVSREQLEDLYDKGDDSYYDILQTVQKTMTDKEKEDFGDSFMRDDPASAPTWMHMEKGVRLPREEWLIHFSDDADRVAWKGFTHGSDDMTRLGLTTYMRKDSKKYGGYNFAFIAQSRDARNAAREGKYGKGAVMFQASGVKSHHYGDQEDQVMFWGPAINKDHLILLQRVDDKWGVVSSGKRDYAYVGEFSDVVNWVIHNHRQYSRQIMKALP